MAPGDRRHRDAADIIARAALARRRGLRVLLRTVADLRAFDCLPDQLTATLRKPGARLAVEAGPPIGICCAGGRRKKLAPAQMLLARGKDGAWTRHRHAENSLRP